MTFHFYEEPQAYKMKDERRRRHKEEEENVPTSPKQPPYAPNNVDVSQSHQRLDFLRASRRCKVQLATSAKHLSMHRAYYSTQVLREIKEILIIMKWIIY